jgi:hypothetical protein
MNHHAAVEVLSSYLDAELPQAEQARVERHLEDCARCRERLSGLRRVVERLENLKRSAPPAHLGQSIEHRVRLEVRREDLLERLERQVERWTTHSAMMPIFALVLALAVIIYLFALGVERSQRGTTIISEPSGTAPASDSVELGGRLFDRTDGIGIERGLAGETARVRLTFPDPEVENWGEGLDLDDYKALGGVVRLRVGQEVIEIDFAGAAEGPAEPHANRQP